MNYITKVPSAKVGHELESCTGSPQPYPIPRADFSSSLRGTLPAKLKRLVVVDNPGFEDTYKSDAQIMHSFIQWFTAQ